MALHRTIDFNGKQIHFKREGKGKTIVLLHGFLESLSIWDDFTIELSKSFKVISIDLPGHGFSDVIAENHTMELMAEVVYKVLEMNDIEECIMVGHSMGGYVTLSFAEKYPAYLKGIVLFNSNALADSPEAKLNRSRAIAIVKKNHKSFINNFIPELFAPENVPLFRKEIQKLQNGAATIGEKAVIAALEGMKSRKSKLDLLSKTNLPVLFIIGKEDPRSNLQAMLEQIVLPKISESLILSNCGHIGYIEKRYETLISLREFANKWL